MRVRVVVCISILSLLAPRAARAQDDPSPWMLMSDGLLFATVNHQGGPRGGDEFVSTNWWMGMASRSAGKGQLTLTGMLSLDAATATARGYRELFQSGEVYHGQPIVDRQHPHDLVMQAAMRLARAARLPHRLHDRGRADRRAGARARSRSCTGRRRRKTRRRRSATTRSTRRTSRWAS